jgi:hypothetical protein
MFSDFGLPLLMGLKAIDSGNPPGYSEFWADTPPPRTSFTVSTYYVLTTHILVLYTAERSAWSYYPHHAPVRC